MVRIINLKKKLKIRNNSILQALVPAIKTSVVWWTLAGCRHYRGTSPGYKTLPGKRWIQDFYFTLSSPHRRRHRTPGARQFDGTTTCSPNVRRRGTWFSGVPGESRAKKNRGATFLVFGNMKLVWFQRFLFIFLLHFQPRKNGVRFSSLNWRYPVSQHRREKSPGGTTRAKTTLRRTIS